MSDDRLRELLAAQPGSHEVAERAQRAREKALQRLPPAVTRKRERPVAWIRLSAAAAAALSLGLLWVSAPRGTGIPAPEPVAVVQPAQPPLQVRMTLSDGTKVVWTLDDRFSM
jgi:hypothetical protein